MLVVDAGPTPEALRRARRATEQVVDDAGGIGLPWLVPSLIDRLFERGTIDGGMYAAARKFSTTFYAASLNELVARDPARTRSDRGARHDLPPRAEAARREVAKAIEACGGGSSPAGSCIWHVLGLDQSLRGWCLRIGWQGRFVSEHVGVGILVSALSVLARFYGLTPRSDPFVA